MRFSILILLALSLAAGVSAQEFSPVTCADGTTIAPQMTITLPAQSPITRDELPEPYFVSVITDENIPALASTDENNVVTCAIPDGLAESVSVAFEYSDGSPESYGLSPYSAWIGAESAVENTIAVSGMSETTMLVIEGGRMERNDRDGDIYTLSMEAALAETVEVRVHVLNVEGTYTPGVSALDENDEFIPGDNAPLSCIPDECLSSANVQASYTGLRVPAYTATAEDVSLAMHTGRTMLRLRVENTQTDGPYTLIFSFRLPKAPEPTITAQAIDNGDGSWLLQCGGASAFERGTRITFDTATISPENPLTITALGGDAPVTMAVFTTPEEGVCVPATESVSVYSATLPDFNIAPTLNGAQVTLDAAHAYVLVGSALPGPITLLVEGWKTPLRETLVAEENPDLATILQPLLTLDVTPGMINSGADLRAYAIATDDLADPVIGILNDAGAPVTDAIGQMAACNDAGIPEQCMAATTALTGYSLTLAEGRVLPGASQDAMVTLSFADLLAQVDSAQPRLHIAAADRTGAGAGGQMILLLSLVTSE